MGQLAGTAEPMVAVGPHPIAEWQSGEDHQRRQRSPKDTETRVAFPHVMQQGSNYGVAIVSPVRHHHESRVITVALVGGLLFEEDAGQLRGQP
jgi:hypothetical protein